MSSYGDDRQGRALVGFSRGQVERALTELGKPVWGPERPLTLLWVAVDDGAGGRALLGADEAAEFGTPTTPQMTELLDGRARGDRRRRGRARLADRVAVARPRRI